MRVLVSLLALVVACEGGGGSAHFRVVNQTAGRVFLQVSPEGYWQLQRGGKVLPALDGCETCNCSDQGCAVCLALGVVAPLDPGGARDWDWDGRIWPIAGTKNGVACQSPELLRPGPAKLSVFHGTTTRETGAGTLVETPVTTTSVDFDHAAGVRVEVVLR